MKPGFALNLTGDPITLLRRKPEGWETVGSVPLDAPDLGAGLTRLRKAALAMAPEGLTAKLVIPNTVILYTRIKAPGPSAKARRRQIEAALEGMTPYAVPDLVFDWSGTGEEVEVAVIARETLDEAEGFAAEHRFNPVSFVARPEPGVFRGEPFFGQTRVAAEILAEGERVQRDQDPIPLSALGQEAEAEAGEAPAPAEVAAGGPEPAGEAAPPAPAETAPEPDTEATPPAEPGRKPAGAGEGDERAAGDTVAGDTQEDPGPEPVAVAASEDGPEGLPETGPEAAPVPADGGPAEDRPADGERIAPAADAADIPAPGQDREGDAGPVPVAGADNGVPAGGGQIADAAGSDPGPGTGPAAGSAEGDGTDTPVPADDIPPPAFSSRRSGIPTLGGAQRGAAGSSAAPADADAPSDSAPDTSAKAGTAPAPPPAAKRGAAGGRGHKDKKDKRGKVARPLPDAAPATPAPGPEAAAATLGGPAVAPPRSEAERMAVFGARGTPPRRGRTGLLLTLGLVLVLALVALWAGRFLDDGPGQTGAADPAGSLPDLAAGPGIGAPEALAEAEADALTRDYAGADTGMPLDPGAAEPAEPVETTGETAGAPETVAEEEPAGAMEPAEPAEPADPAVPDEVAEALETPEPVALDEVTEVPDTPALAEDTAQDTAQDTDAPDLADSIAAALREAVEGPATDPATDPAPAAMVAPDGTEGAPTEETAGTAAIPPDDTAEAAPASGSADGAGSSDPVADETEIADTPPEGAASALAVSAGDETAHRPAAEIVDEIFLSSPDPGVLAMDRVALLALPEGNPDTPPSAAVPPPPFGTVYQFDADGFVVPTAEGVTTPDGVLLFAGRPPLVPPARPAGLAPEPDPAAPEAEVVEAVESPEPADEPPAFVSDERLAGFRPRARPAGLAPEAEAEPAADPAPAGTATAPGDDAALDTGLPDPATPGSEAETAGFTAIPRPPNRPGSILALAEEAAQREAEAAATSPLAVAVSRHPARRPAGLSGAVAAAVASASAAAAAPTAPEDDGEPAVAGAAPQIPTRASVAQQATFSRALNLRRINLIGVYGTDKNRHALVRQSNGRYVRVRVGDRLDGGQVSAIGANELLYIKGGRTHRLEMPTG